MHPYNHSFTGNTEPLGVRVQQRGSPPREMVSLPFALEGNGKCVTFATSPHCRKAHIRVYKQPGSVLKAP